MIPGIEFVAFSDILVLAYKMLDYVNNYNLLN